MAISATWKMIEDCTSYMREHLDEEMTAKQLAARYGYSLYHFCHVFKVCCGVSPGKYIRSLRLERAKEEITSGTSITQAGLGSGFHTCAGFSKAFRKEYGFSARDYLKQIRERMEMRMKMEIKQMEPLFALGYEIDGEYDRDYSKSGAYWSNVDFKGYPLYPEGMEDLGEVAMWMHPDDIAGELKYFFGFLTKPTETPEGFVKVEIPAGEYAVFTVEGKEGQEPQDVARAVRDLWRYVFTEWLDGQEEYEMAHGMCYECYKGNDALVYLSVQAKK